MAAYGWGTNSSIKDWLFAEGYRFDFFQAVRLLELLAPDHPGVGQSADPICDPVQFRSRISQSFPPSDIAGVGHSSQVGRPPYMDVNFMSLAGAFGPLPAPYTDFLLERLAKKEFALKEFLDLFNHRLVSLAYRIRKTFRVGFEWKAPQETHLSNYLFSLVGLNTPGLHHRLQVPDLSLVAFGGLMAHQVRSLAGLERVLCGYFQTSVRVQSFLGGWQPLDSTEWTRLGRAGANRELGRTTALGTRVWDQHQQLLVTMGPLTPEQFQTFLPVGWGFHSLQELTNWYVGSDHKIRYALKLHPHAKAPECRLSATSSAARLGWSSWLGSQRTASLPQKALVSSPVVLQVNHRQHRTRQVILSRRSGQYASHVMGHPLFKGLPLTEIAEISRHMVARRVGRGTVVVRQGEPGESLFIIGQGKAEVIVRSIDGKERHVATLGTGEFFGEMALLTGKPRTATVVMLEDGTVHELGKDALHQILARCPRIQQTLSTYLRKRSLALSQVA